jgi:hypothetical protein
LSGGIAIRSGARLGAGFFSAARFSVLIQQPAPAMPMCAHPRGSSVAGAVRRPPEAQGDERECATRHTFWTSPASEATHPSRMNSREILGAVRLELAYPRRRPLSGGAQEECATRHTRRRRPCLRGAPSHVPRRKCSAAACHGWSVAIRTLFGTDYGCYRECRLDVAAQATWSRIWGRDVPTTAPEVSKDPLVSYAPPRTLRQRTRAVM